MTQTTFEQGLDSVAELVKRFGRNAATYRSPEYNETRVRIEFINPLFEALGWDVNNREGVAPQYQEVLHEFSAEVEGTRKAPDYAFRTGSQAPKFYVEAKKPGVNVKTNADAAYQLRRYAWSARLPLSLLTDFEELAVYDCRSRPSNGDKASVGRVQFYACASYPDRWRDIWDVFSRQAVREGSFDRFAQREKGKGELIDAEFLKEIQGWRELLARNMALRNAWLAPDDLNDAVQRTIDRIIFMRMAEDRGIEEYGRLLRLAAPTPSPSPVKGTGEGSIYADLIDLCRRADARYNSGLFDLSADTLTPRLSVDDKALQSIIGNLYFPSSPYEFSVLPIRILGNIYEQFLGQVIRLTAGHQAKVEEKPQVKKAGGVYYTPEYIVDYIVKNTVGRLVEGKSPKQLASFRVLDMSCGSGSFLLGAYQCLLDYYLHWYVEHNPAKYPNAVWQRGEEWRLTIAEKKRILTTHIFGVDIDRQAVEVTKLSLLLKVLEGESDETLGQQLTLFQERALPNLDSNVKCGNSLIGPDYFTGQLLPDVDELRRVNAFDWATQFPDAMKAGGFDCVVGNPPYVRSQSLGATQREYYQRKYETATGTYDIYVLFVERTLNLMNSKAKAGFILPNKFFTTDYGEGLRRILGRKQLVERLVDFEDAQVFAGAGTYTTLLFLSNVGTERPEYARLGAVYRDGGSIGLANALTSSNISFDSLALTDDGSRWTLAAGHTGKLLLRLQEHWPLFLTLNPHIFQGLKTSADKIYLVKVEQIKKNVCSGTNGLGEHFTVEHGILKPVVKGEHVQRYHIDESTGLFIVYPYKVAASGRAVLMDQKEMTSKFPLAWSYLSNYRKTLGARDGGAWEKRSDWYAYARSQNIATFLGYKILMPYMTTRLRVASDKNGELFFVNITTGGYGVRIGDKLHDPAYIVGILNSALMNHCIRQMTNQFRGGYFAVNKQALERLPFRPISFSDPADMARHDRMVTLVEQMLELHKRLAAASQAERELYQRQIDATDQEIDGLVYELYELTQEEIQVVAGND